MKRTRHLRTALPALLSLLLPALSGCDYISEVATQAQIKVFGITVCDPDKESAEWVLMKTLQAMNAKDPEKGWEDFQKLLYSSERTLNALRGWRQMTWKRLRKQRDHYLDEDGCYKIVKQRKIESSRGKLQGLEFYVQSKYKDMGTPCAVSRDKGNKGRWRIKRCSF